MNLTANLDRAYFAFERLTVPLFCGVPLTDEHLSNAAEIIADFIKKSGTGYLFKGIILKQRYIKTGENEKRISAWLETVDGHRLSAKDMENLKFRFLQ